jgi:hypothetical protein
MSGRIRRRVAWSAALLSLAAVASVAIVAVSNADPGPPIKGHDVHAHFRNIVQHFGCPDSTAVPIAVCSTFDADGDIKGDGYVVIDTDPVPPNVDPKALGFSEAHTVIHTKKGDLACHEAALFDLIGPDHAFVDECIIDGDQSTGKYAGTSGYLQENGTFDFTAGVGQADVTGKIYGGP